MASQEPGLQRMELLIGNMRGLDQMILKILSNSCICYSKHTSLCIVCLLSRLLCYTETYTQHNLF